VRRDQGRTKANDLSDFAGAVRTDMVRVAISCVGITTAEIMAGDDVTRRTVPGAGDGIDVIHSHRHVVVHKHLEVAEGRVTVRVRSGEIKRQHDVVFVAAGRMIERVLQNKAEGTRIVV